MIKMCAKLPQDYSKTFQMLWLGGEKKRRGNQLGLMLSKQADQ